MIVIGPRQVAAKRRRPAPSVPAYSKTRPFFPHRRGKELEFQRNGNAKVPSSWDVPVSRVELELLNLLTTFGAAESSVPRRD
jgi:hypothetical protein